MIYQYTLIQGRMHASFDSAQSLWEPKKCPNLHFFKNILVLQAKTAKKGNKKE